MLEPRESDLSGTASIDIRRQWCHSIMAMALGQKMSADQMFHNQSRGLVISHWN